MEVKKKRVFQGLMFRLIGGVDGSSCIFLNKANENIITMS